MLKLASQSQRYFVAMFVLPLLAGLLGVAGVVSASPATANGSGTGGNFVAVQNVRLVNTQTGLGGSSSAFSSGETRTYHVPGVAGLPATGISAVALTLSVVATTATSEGSAVVYRSGDARPGTTNLRIRSDNVPDSNTALVQLGSDGNFKLYVSAGAADVLVDVQGYTTSTSAGPGGLVAVDAARLVDTRGGYGTPSGLLAPGTYNDIQITGRAGIPANAQAVVVNIVALGASSDGYLKALPPSAAIGSVTPLVRYDSQGESATGAIAELDSGGVLRVYNYVSGSSVHYVIDVQGYISADAAAGGGFTPTVGRIYDSRSTVQIAPSQQLDVSVGGNLGIPVYGAEGVAVNVTVLAPNNSGYLRVWRAGNVEPDTSATSFKAGEGSSNLLLVRPGDNGKITIKNRSAGTLDVVLDVQGWFASSRLIAASAEDGFINDVLASGGTADEAHQAVYDQRLLDELPVRVEQTIESVAEDESDPGLLTEVDPEVTTAQDTETPPSGATTLAAEANDPESVTGPCPPGVSCAAKEGTCGAHYKLGTLKETYIAYNVTNSQIFKISYRKRFCYSASSQKVGTTYQTHDTLVYDIFSASWSQGAIEGDGYYTNGKKAHKSWRRINMKHCLVWKAGCWTRKVTFHGQVFWDGSKIAWVTTPG